MANPQTIVEVNSSLRRVNPTAGQQITAVDELNGNQLDANSITRTGENTPIYVDESATVKVRKIMFSSNQTRSRQLNSPRTVLNESTTSPLQRWNFSNRSSARRTEPGGSTATALNIPPFRGARTFNERISPRDRDFYRFTLSTESEVDVLWRNFSNRNLSVALLNQRGVVVRDDDDRLSATVRPGGRTRFDTDDLNSGVYFVRITGGGTGRYQFRLRIDPD